MSLPFHKRPVVEVEGNMEEDSVPPVREDDSDSHLPSMLEKLARYVRAVKAGHPVREHPSESWLGKVCGLAAQQGSGLSESHSSTAEDFPIVSQFAALEGNMSARFAQVETLVKSLQVRQVLGDVDRRQTTLDQRERERSLRVGSFVNEYSKQHATDLFDIQMLLEDTSESSRLVRPELFNRHRASASQGTLDEEAVDRV